MDDLESKLSVERHAEERTVDGLLREALRDPAGRDASLERMLARVRGTGRSPSGWSFRVAAAAVLLIGLGVVWVASSPAGPLKIVSGSALAKGNRVVTGDGEKAALELADRSVVRVAENTELVVRPNSAGLQVEMPQGQATFEVTKKEPGKSFEVSTAHGRIVVHGTKFSATVDQGALVVRVEEGCVEVRNALGSARLYPGEHAILTQDRAPDKKEKLYLDPINVTIPPIATDPSVKYDYDIVYVRARRAGDEVHKRFYTDFSQPVTMEPGADLMLLHPDGSEELLAEGGSGSITDPVISFDGQWVYFSRLYNLQKANQWSPPAEGADLFKLHLKSRKLVRLSNQVFTPNTGAANWASDTRNTSRKEGEKNWIPYGVFNMGPCPLPGGKIAFTSNREGFRPSKGYPAIALQLFVMDDREESVAADDPAPANLHKIGHLNIAGALHPVVLRDGRIMFSSLESQGIRSEISWGIWTIHPDGTNWGPLVSAFDPGGASNGFHFQSQLSDGSIIVEEYYNQNNSGFGAYIQIPATLPDGYPAFGPGYMNDPRNGPWRFGRFDNGKGKWYRMPFMPTNSISFTPFSLNQEGEADTSVVADKKSPRVGKFTHPSSAPDNNLLTIYSPGPVNHQYKYLPQLDGGIYLIKGGRPVQQPAEMRLIKNDPEYNECWPRAVVPYERIYGIKEPKTIAPLANDGKLSPHLPEGTPFGLVGTSSLYKRESYPNGVVPEGQVTSTYAGGKDPWRGLDPFTSHGNGMPLNWHNQGGDAGLYGNDEMHALRVLVMEPTSDRREGPRNGRRFYNHASERLRILGEIPVRKFQGGKEPNDPDQNPDTSFLARIPADTAFTFQTIDRNGLVLNMSQTWHQVRPGEIRVNCGGCHAHSQKPTLFEETAAAKPDYKIWDLVSETPLVTSKAKDESGKTWDAKDETGLRMAKGAVTVEYFRDIQPILKRSCAACHTKASEKPAGNLVLDADDELIPVENLGKFPGTYVRLALDERAKFGFKPVGYDSWGYPNASR
ncbi:MAG TPA: FecR domain-containing protein, partial [Planctomycetota bacterium]|nr:FecR domain-containing protein [Planctomycetota bacterium]